MIFKPSTSVFTRRRRVWAFCFGLALTVVAFLQNVRRRDVHNLLDDKRKRLLRGCRDHGVAGSKRHCHGGFTGHCCLTSSRGDRGEGPVGAERHLLRSERSKISRWRVSSRASPVNRLDHGRRSILTPGHGKAAPHKPLVLRGHPARPLDIRDAHAPPTHTIVGCDWLPALSIGIGFSRKTELVQCSRALMFPRL